MKVNLEIELLRTLLAFADTGSFKRASELVFRSQPAVSMQMKRLEQLSGQKLFERQGRDVVLTEQGLHLVINARQLVAAHDRLVEEIRGEEVGGEVKIGIPDDYAGLVLPELLHRFEEFHPSVSLNIVANTSPVLADKLGTGELDLAVLAMTAAQDIDVVLTREPIVWVSSRDTATYKKRPLVLALFSDDSPIYVRTIERLSELSKIEGAALDFRIGVTSKSSSVLIAAAAAGFAVATMARCVVPDDLRVLNDADGFPELGHVDIVLRASPESPTLAAARVSQEIVDSFRAGPSISG